MRSQLFYPDSPIRISLFQEFQHQFYRQYNVYKVLTEYNGYIFWILNSLVILNQLGNITEVLTFMLIIDLIPVNNIFMFD